MMRFSNISSNIRNMLYLPGDAWVLAFSAAVWSIGGSMVNPYQSIYFSCVGSDSIFIGYLLAMSSGVTALMQLIGGYVADSWGRRKVIVIFSFLSVISAFVYIFIDQHELLIIPIMLASIAGIYGPAFNAMLTDSMQPELRTRGVASFTLVTSIPSIFCPYVGGMLMQSFGNLLGLRISYFLSGFFGLVGVSYRALNLKETYSGTRSGKTKGLYRFILDFAKDNAFFLKNASSGVKNLLLYSVLTSLGTGMTVPYASLYVVETLEVQPSYYGIVTNIAGVISVILLLPATRVAEKVGLKKSAIYASISVPLTQLIFVRAKGMDDLAMWSIIGSAGSVLLGPSLTALQAELSTQETRGRMMALFSFSSLITSVPAQIFGGYLYNSMGPHSPFLASIPAFILATISLAKIKIINMSNN
jgi:MFS family permease